MPDYCPTCNIDIDEGYRQCPNCLKIIKEDYCAWSLVNTGKNHRT